MAVPRYAYYINQAGRAVNLRFVNDAYVLGSGERDGFADALPSIDFISQQPEVVVLRLPLDVLQARIEAEGQWEAYVNFMFGTPQRRNAFLKIIMIGQPVAINGSPVRTSFTNAGFSQAQIDRILAPL